MMQSYEIRLLKSDGSAAMIYVTSCETDAEAVVRVREADTVEYDRYEIIEGHRRVAEGAKSPVK
jgi:hypothetical protein